MHLPLINQNLYRLPNVPPKSFTNALLSTNEISIRVNVWPAVTVPHLKISITVAAVLTALGKVRISGEILLG